MKNKKEKKDYITPQIERFKLRKALNILDTLSIHSEWEDFVDGDDEDQY